MKKKICAALTVLALILGLLSAPASLAEARYTASTPLEDASRNNLKNIRRAAEAINGLEIESGEKFSFNDIVGPRTKSQGYVPAENARGVSVTGGGVSQVATTLYLALLRLGDHVEYTALSTYGARFQGSYVSDGNKAVITDYGGDTDFAFINHTGDMTIEMWTSSSALNCVITVADTPADGTYYDRIESAPSADGNPAMPIFTSGVSTGASASIPCGGGKGTLKNVEQAARSVNGTRLNTGDVFSFNGIVGPRTKKRGYVGGINGRGAKVTGGGVAQVASVVWLAVKQLDDVSIIEKSTYGNRYNQDYVASSADAILTDYNSEKDFSFRYKGKGAIVIYTSVNGDTLTCDIVRE